MGYLIETEFGMDFTVATLTAALEIVLDCVDRQIGVTVLSNVTGELLISYNKKEKDKYVSTAIKFVI